MKTAAANAGQAAAATVVVLRADCVSAGIFYLIYSRLTGQIVF